MALSILSKPQILMPAYNPVPLVFTSTNQTLEGHQFILDIYSAGTTTNRITREKTPANPDGYGVFESHSILRNFVTYDKTNFNATGVTSSYPNRFKYDMYLGEEYVFDWDFGDNFATGPFGVGIGNKVGFTSYTSNPHYFSVGDVVYIEQDAGYQWEQYNGVHEVIYVFDDFAFAIDVNHTASTVDSGSARYADNRKTIFSGISAITSIWVNNAAFSHIGWPDYDVDDWNMTGHSAYLWTDAPDYYEMDLTSRAWMNCFMSTGGTAFRFLIVQTFDKNNNQVGAYTLNLAGVGTAAEPYYKIGCGPWNISATTFAVSGGTLPIFKDNVTHYSFHIRDAVGNYLTREKFINISQLCDNRYENIEIIFGDRKGSFLSRSFQLAHTEGDDIEKTEYTKPIGKYNPSTNKWTYASKDRGRTTLYTNAQTRYTATSNWVDINDVDYLRQLYSSSEVYWNRGGTLIPIIITNKFYPVPSLEVDRIFNLTIEFELAYMDEIPCN